MAWRAQISFVERLETVSHLTQKLQDTKAEDLKIARNSAKDIEKQIFASSNSTQSYRASCASAIQGDETNTKSLEDSASSDEDAPSSPSSVAIGVYGCAKHHRDGLFSSIFKARAPSKDGSRAVGPLVALKVTTPSMMIAPHDSRREARILQNLTHAQVIPLLDLFEQPGGRLVLVLPFMPYDLQSLLDQRCLTHGQARSCLKNMFEALSFLHETGLIHRDIKPSNILLKTPSGPAYLADFGIAWYPGDPTSEPINSKITDVGTTSYRPPELLFGQRRYDCRLDLWAAGCVVAEADSLSGKTLFDAGDLGSELALIQSIFKSLGTPTLAIWPEAATFPDWGKMAFREFPPKSWLELLPSASESGRELVSRLVRFESNERLSASGAIQHRYFLEGQ